MTITLTEARHRLESLALHQPDMVAGGDGTSCAYFHYDGKPFCIVGAAFESELKEVGVHEDSYLNEDSVQGLVSAEVLDIEPEALVYLEAAQEQQDQGMPWGEAVPYAEKIVTDSIALNLIGYDEDDDEPEHTDSILDCWCEKPALPVAA